MTSIEQQVILVTGATDGLGREVATSLARQGATVLLHGRNQDKGATLADDLRHSTGNSKIRYYNADLSSLSEVRQLAATIRAAEPRLTVLANNAGIGPVAPQAPRRTSADGHELFFAVNYLAGYLLTHALLPLLRASAPARIINVASIGQQALAFDDVMLIRDYDDARAYRQSKLAQILFTFDLTEQLHGTSVTVNCLHPATLMNTRMVLDSAYFPGAKSTIAEGVTALEHLMLGTDLAGVSGQYFEGLEPGRPNEQAQSPDARRQLRDLSARLTQATS